MMYCFYRLAFTFLETKEKFYVTKENIAHTTSDDYLTQQFEVVTDNNVSTVFDPSFISFVSGSRSMFYLDKLSDHHWLANQSIFFLNWYFDSKLKLQIDQRHITTLYNILYKARPS